MMTKKWLWTVFVMLAFFFCFYAPVHSQPQQDVQYGQQQYNESEEDYVLDDPAYMKSSQPVETEIPVQEEPSSTQNETISIQEETASVEVRGETISAEEQVEPVQVEVVEVITTPLVADILATIPVPDPVLPFCWARPVILDYYDWYYANFAPVIYPAFVYEPAVFYWGSPVVYSGFWWRGHGWYGHYGFYHGHGGWYSHGYSHHGFYGSRHGFRSHGVFGPRYHVGHYDKFRGSHHPITQRRIADHRIGYKPKIGMARGLSSHHNAISPGVHGGPNQHGDKFNHSPSGSVHNASMKSGPEKMSRQNQLQGVKNVRNPGQKELTRDIKTTKGPNQKATLHDSRTGKEIGRRGSLNSKSISGDSGRGMERRTSLNQPLGSRGEIENKGMKSSGSVPRTNLNHLPARSGNSVHQGAGMNTGQGQGSGRANSTLSHQPSLNAPIGQSGRNVPGQFGNRNAGQLGGRQSGSFGGQMQQRQQPMMRTPASAPRSAPAPKATPPPQQQQKKR